MTDRHAGYIVTLERDIREDDAEALVTALQMLKGVLTVKPLISDASLHMAEERARSKLGQEVFDVIYQRKENGR